MKLFIIALVCIFTATMLAQAQHYCQKPVVVQTKIVKTVPVYDFQQRNVFIVPVAPPYYYSVNDNSEDLERRIADAVVSRIGINKSVVTVSKESFRVVGGGVGQGDQVLSIFNATCIQCHKPGSSKPGVQLFTADRRLYRDADQKKEQRRRQRVYDSIESGDMPKHAAPLSNSQKSVIRNWSK